TSTLINLGGNVTVTPEDLHLLISAIERQNSNSDNNKPQASPKPIIINLDDSITVSKNTDSGNSGSVRNDSGVPATIFTQEAINSIQTQIQTQISESNKTGIPLEVLDLYFDKKVDMNPLLIRYLCEQVSLPKRCHFNYKNQHFVLFIPAFDLTNPAYPDGLAQLDKEPARTAGFLRIEQIFKPLGFATRIVEEENADAITQ
ncbi:MAG: hypothetical protein IKZ97_04345, partial [Butyrivibrio sp.]|nr:hypothetical protein [Butyrivibrio sp.]